MLFRSWDQSLVHLAPDAHMSLPVSVCLNVEMNGSSQPHIVDTLTNPVDTLTNPVDTLTNPVDTLTNPVDSLTNPTQYSQ